MVRVVRRDRRGSQRLTESHADGSHLPSIIGRYGSVDGFPWSRISHPPDETPARAGPAAHTPLRPPTVPEAPARASAHAPLWHPLWTRRPRKPQRVYRLELVFVWEAPARVCMRGARAGAGGRPPRSHSAYPAGDTAVAPRRGEAPARVGRTRTPTAPATRPGSQIGKSSRDPGPTAKSQTCARGNPRVALSWAHLLEIPYKFAFAKSFRRQRSPGGGVTHKSGPQDI
jgi:hypothetical protein